MTLCRMNIAELESELAVLDARRVYVDELAAKAAASLVRAKEDHAAHIAAVAAGTASPAAATALHVADATVSTAQEAVQAIEAEHAETSRLLSRAKHAALIAALQADIDAARKLAAEVDAAAECLNRAYQEWLDANEEIGRRFDHVALTGAGWQPYGEAHPGALLISVFNPDVETANRLNVIVPRGKRLEECA